MPYVPVAALLISIHALREEGDPYGWLLLTVTVQFLSTPSARRATTAAGACGSIGMHFYPRPPRGGRRLMTCRYQCPPCISIHALREEGDLVRAISAPRSFPISIHALREEGDAASAWGRGCRNAISIHALREEGDFQPIFPPPQWVEFLSTPSARRATSRPRGPGPPGRNFYPRPPRGGRRPRLPGPDCPSLFLSTPSARRATYFCGSAL